MNRSDLIDALAGRFGQLALADTELAVKTILEALHSALGAGSRIEIRGFGSFTVTEHAPRLGRNPKNGDSVLIPARRVLKFKPGKALRESVDQGLAQSRTKPHKGPAPKFQPQSTRSRSPLDWKDVGRVLPPVDKP